MVGLRNALATETATASVDSCSILQIKMNEMERKNVGKRVALMLGMNAL